jgi:hypothetical protein
MFRTLIKNWSYNKISSEMSRYLAVVSVSTREEATDILGCAAIARWYLETTPLHNHEFPTFAASGKGPCSEADRKALLLYNVHLVNMIKESQSQTRPEMAIFTTGFIYWLMVFRGLISADNFAIGRQILAKIVIGADSWQLRAAALTNGKLSSPFIDKFSPLEHNLVTDEMLGEHLP